jgi:hypothetical protein
VGGISCEKTETAKIQQTNIDITAVGDFNLYILPPRADYDHLMNLS